MIFDMQSIFSDAQAITVDTLSTNIIDLGAPGTPFGGRVLVPDHGKSIHIPMFIAVGATFNNLTSLLVELRNSANADMSSHKVVLSKSYLLAELVAGTELAFPECLYEGLDRRYMALYYDVTGTAPTTGNITSGIVAARQTNFARHY